MFADTITITINAVAKILNRINQDNGGSEYFLRGALDDFRLKIRHTSYTNKASGRIVDRHNVEFVQTVYPVAPATASTIRKAYLVLEAERVDAITDPLNFSLGYVGFFTSPNVTKLLQYES